MIERRVRLSEFPDTKSFHGDVCKVDHKSAMKASQEFRRGFSTTALESRNVNFQNIGSILTHDSYGSGKGLKAQNHANASATVSSLFSDNTSSEWTTTAKCDLENSISRKSQVGSTSPMKLTSPSNKSLSTNNMKRFETELKRTTTYCADKVKNIKVEPLPGTPLCLINYRHRLILKYDIMGITLLRYILLKDGDNISDSDCIYRLKSLLPETSRYEIDQIIAYFTSSDTINVNEVVRVLLGRIDGFPNEQIQQQFKQLCKPAINISEPILSTSPPTNTSTITLANTTTTTTTTTTMNTISCKSLKINTTSTLDTLKITVHELLNHIDTTTTIGQNIYQQLSTSISIYIHYDIVTNKPEDMMNATLGIQEFLDIHYDMFASNTDTFFQCLSTLWK